MNVEQILEAAAVMLLLARHQGRVPVTIRVCQDYEDAPSLVSIFDVPVRLMRAEGVALVVG